MKKTWLTLSMCTLVLGLAAGCGDDDGGSTGISLDDDEVLGELSADEQEQLCDDVEEFMSSSAVAGPVNEMACRFAGIFAASFAAPTTDAEARAACSEAYDACEDEGEPTDTECQPPSDTCQATVGELKACLEDYPDMMESFRDLFPSCDELTLELLNDMGEVDPGMLEVPASCETLSEKCPDSPLTTDPPLDVE